MYFHQHELSFLRKQDSLQFIVSLQSRKRANHSKITRLNEKIDEKRPTKNEEMKDSERIFPH